MFGSCQTSYPFRIMSRGMSKSKQHRNLATFYSFFPFDNTKTYLHSRWRYSLAILIYIVSQRTVVYTLSLVALE
jgi:hypothetical protein